MAVALCEAGAKIHALDLPSNPSSDFAACVVYVDKLKNGSSLTYHPTDVTDQTRIASLIVDKIAKENGRLDLCVAAAGILGPAEGESCMTYSKKDWERVMRVNLDGVFYTSQAAAKAMVDTGCKAGSIVMIASMSGSITNKVGRAFGTFTRSDPIMLTVSTNHRTNLGWPTTRPNRESCKWLEAWLASWARRTFASIPSRPASIASSLPVHVDSMLICTIATDLTGHIYTKASRLRT